MNLQSTESADAGWRAANPAHVTLSGDFITGQAPAQAAPRRAAEPAAGAESRQDVPVDEIGFSAMKTARDIDSIKYLRGELSLAESVLSDPEFHALEKKETSTAWWAPSSAATH